MIRIDYCMLDESYCFIVRTKIAGDTPIIFSLLIFSLFSHLFRHFHLNGHLPLRAISILTELSVSRFMRSDVKMNLLVKLFSPEGKKLNHFFFCTDLVLSEDESMNQVRNGKSRINDLYFSWSKMIDCLGSWLLVYIKIFIIYK